MAAKDIPFSLDARVRDTAWTHLREKRPAEAESLFLQVLGRAPRDVQAMYGLAQAYLAVGHHEEGIRVARRALKLAPDSAPLHSTLGLLLAATGQLGRARDAFRTAQRLEPAALAHSLNLGAALHRLAEYRAAADAYRSVVQRASDTAAAWLGLGRVLLDDEQPREALASLEHARALVPTDPAVHMDLGATLRRLDLVEEAIRAFRSAASLPPDPTPAIHALAATLRSVGRVQEAAETLRAALASKPDASRLRVSLAYTIRYTTRDAEVQQLESLAESLEHAGTSSHAAWFAVAKVRRDLGEHESAFDATEHANRARRAEFDFDVAPHAERFAEVRSTLDTPPVPPSSEPSAPTPIFVLGMPRSGTTLLEQILASHPDVYGGGELTPLVRVLERGPLPRPYPHGITRAKPADLAATGRAYHG